MAVLYWFLHPFFLSLVHIMMGDGLQVQDVRVTQAKLLGSLVLTLDHIVVSDLTLIQLRNRRQGRGASGQTSNEH